MINEAEQKLLADWFRNHLKDYNELWKTIKFKQRLKTIVVPSLNEHGFDISSTGARVTEFTRVRDGIGDIIYIDYLRNIVDRYRRTGSPSIGVLGEFRVKLRLLDIRSQKDLVPYWLFFRFTPPRNVLPWNGEWPFKDAATLDQLLKIFVQEFDMRGNKVFELARRGASREELTEFAGEALRSLSEEEWDNSPWAGGEIVVERNY